MKCKAFRIWILLMVAAVSTVGQTGTHIKTIRDLSTELPDLLQESDTPGMSIAVIREGKIAWKGAFGVKNADTKEPVSDDTIFEAASLTKPITAYAAFKLIDQGKLDLDVPLNKYLGNDYDVENDRRIDQITARRVLSHTSGFPNWRPSDSKALPIIFDPGEKFSYSGEGFVYLSKVIEKITGREFGEYVKNEVLIPLGMRHSSLNWERDFYRTKTFNHDALGRPRGQNADKGVNAAASLHTTATDYATFVIALLEGKGLSAKSRELMMTPQVKIDEKDYPSLEWGLGVGLEMSSEGKSFWHWGDNGFNRSFVIANLKTGDGVVFLTNGTNGLSFVDEVLKVLPGAHPSAKWIGYDRYDSPSGILFRNAAKGDPKEAVDEYLRKRASDKSKWITERQMNRLGYDLMRVGKTDAALEVFRQNTVDHPDSGNVWDSFAECYLAKGDKENAVKFYRKSLAVDPENKNAEEQIGKIEGDKKAPDNR